MISSTKRRISKIYPDTELVFINSSRPRLGDGPAARVLKRKDGYYMLPVSPQTPTLRGRPGEDSLSGIEAANSTKKNFISTEGEVVFGSFFRLGN